MKSDVILKLIIVMDFTDVVVSLLKLKEYQIEFPFLTFNQSGFEVVVTMTTVIVDD